jgi:small subunit ribosomal protein S3
VWVFKGEIMQHDPMASEKRQTEGADQGSTRRPPRESAA